MQLIALNRPLRACSQAACGVHRCEQQATGCEGLARSQTTCSGSSAAASVSSSQGASLSGCHQADAFMVSDLLVGIQHPAPGDTSNRRAALPACRQLGIADQFDGMGPSSAVSQPGAHPSCSTCLPSPPADCWARHLGRWEEEGCPQGQVEQLPGHDPLRRGGGAPGWGRDCAPVGGECLGGELLAALQLRCNC